MKSKSIKGKSLKEIDTAIQDCMSDGFNPTLAIVFLSVKQDRKGLTEILNSKIETRTSEIERTFQSSFKAIENVKQWIWRVRK